MREINLNEREVQTVVAVFEEIQKMGYVKQNTFLGSLTIEEMNKLQQKLRVWYNEQDDDDEWYEVDDDYALNCPCDTYGMCAGPSCSRYFECQK